jgi:diaminohydroxyphosphoribosylaminopyrimidine deaminase/5-amino-6-(5-phosphoribosylamino)uracil reductase
MVGTGTVLADDPRLSVRDETDVPLPRERQPLRAVMGLRELPPDRRVLDGEADTVQLRTRDPRDALATLFARDRQHVFLEGGPTLAAAFLRAGLVDEVVAYVAPMLLSGGRHAVEELDIATIADALRLDVEDVTVLGLGADRNVRLTMTPPRTAVTAPTATRPAEAP